jgi:hypothetical protein
MAKFLSDEFSIVYAIKPADNQAGADGDSINTAYVSHILFILQCGSLTGDAVLTVKSGASDGTKTTSETFYYRLAGADQAATGADVYAAPTSATTLTLTEATYDNKVLLIEVPVDALTAGQPFVTLNLSNAADAHNSSCVAICKPRYTGATATSVIA